MDEPRALPSALARLATIVGILLAAPLAVAADANAGAAHATDDTPPGKPALDRAKAAWEKGDYDIAEPLYAEAVERGGLAPADVLEAYVHLGAARAVLGKKPGAVAAFKSAALLDPAFVVPPEVGKRALALAEQARRQAAKTGAVSFHAEIPPSVPARASAGVDVTLDPAHAAMPGTTIDILAHEPQGGATHAGSVPAAPTAHFDLPASLSLPSTTLQVRVDWRDAHANRLASVEEQIHVQASSNSLIAGAVPPATAGDSGSHHGFWHSAWPYILGGAALAAGGAAVYFATRPGGDVNVTGVHVITH